MFPPNYCEKGAVCEHKTGVCEHSRLICIKNKAFFWEKNMEKFHRI